MNSCTQENKKEFYDNGQLKESGKIINNKKEGVWKEFYKEGEVKAILHYENGLRSGDFTVFHQNGVVAKKGKLIKDTIPIGKWQWFYENKQLKKEGVLDNKGNQFGEWKAYHKNGLPMIIANFPTGKEVRYFDDGVTIEEKGFYKNGKKDSIWQTFYRSGTPRFIKTYKNGLKHGVAKSFFKNGRLDQKGFWFEGEAEGEWEEFEKEGYLKRRYLYKKGEEVWIKDYTKEGVLEIEKKFIKILGDSIVETFHSYYTTDKLLAEKGFTKEGYLFYNEFYENGKVKVTANQISNGNYRHNTYHENGQIKSSFIYEEYKEGFRNDDEYFNKLTNGNWKEFHENGTIAEEFSTKNGIIVGTHKIFYANNKLKKVINYNDEGDEVGEKISFHKNGNKTSYTHYDENGKKDMTKTFFENGNISEELTLKNGVMLIFKEYYNTKDNKLKSISYYDERGNGNKTSYTHYDENGKKDMTKTFFENGNISKEEILKSGVLVTIKEYYHNTKDIKLRSITYYDEKGEYKTAEYYDEDGTKLKRKN
ncbi:toxin-antitoxin system YwqK family antitoxin [Tenacibaculum jejuense]|nr:hypothetical protein [Tenacibaculum jejuense]